MRVSVCACMHTQLCWPSARWHAMLGGARHCGAGSQACVTARMRGRVWCDCVGVRVGQQHTRWRVWPGVWACGHSVRAVCMVAARPTRACAHAGSRGCARLRTACAGGGSRAHWARACAHTHRGVCQWAWARTRGCHAAGAARKFAHTHGRVGGAGCRRKHRRLTAVIVVERMSAAVCCPGWLRAPACPRSGTGGRMVAQARAWLARTRTGVDARVNVGERHGAEHRALADVRMWPHTHTHACAHMRAHHTRVFAHAGRRHWRRRLLPRWRHTVGGAGS